MPWAPVECIEGLFRITFISVLSNNIQVVHLMYISDSHEPAIVNVTDSAEHNKKQKKLVHSKSCEMTYLEMLV